MLNPEVAALDQDLLTDIHPTAHDLRRLYDPHHVRRVAFAANASPVQVCIDARLLEVEGGTGVATYATVLAQCLAGAGTTPAVFDGRAGDRPRRRLMRWMSALDRQPRPVSSQPRAAGPQDLAAVAGWAGPDLFREAQVFFNLHGQLMPVACANPPQVMHWTYPTPLYVRGARNLYTIHDLIPLTDPGLTTISERRHRRLLEQIAGRAHGLVTVSETIRAALVDRLGCPPGFVTNTYQAALAPLQRDPPLPAGLRSGRYFLVCGTVEPRKNLAALIAAHARCGAPLPLVVVGPAAGAEALEKLIAQQPHVIRLPWQPRPALIGLIRRARAVLFPSLAEGFGLPIAEAMTLGAPVMTSNLGATAEIAGAAARLVDPRDIGAMAEAIAELARDAALCARLRMAGFERARLFAPDVYKRRLRALYAATMAAPLRTPRGERL